MPARGARVGNHSSRLWVILALTVLPLLAFIPVFSADFLTWDDYDNVAKNPAITGNSDVAAWWTNLDKPYGELYIPLTYTVWSAIASFAQLDAPRADGIRLSAGAFHAANILVHLGSTLLVYLILLRIIGRRWPAVFGALLFAVHPVQVESVAWVTGMKDVLSGFLSLAAIYAFLRFAEQHEPPRLDKKKQRRNEPERARWIWYAIALISFILSTVAKPSSVIVPLLAAIVAWTARSTQGRDGDDTPSPSSRFVSLALSLAPWLVVSLLIIIETRHAQPASRVEHVAPGMRPLIAGDALAFYAKHVVLPLHLAPDYGRTPAAVIQSGAVYWTWVAPIVVILLGVILRKRVRGLLAGMAIFFAALLPVAGLLSFSFQMYSTVADHYMYVAMFGAAMVMAGLVNRFWNRATAIASAGVLLALCVATYVQATRWHDTVRLFTYTLTINPRSFVSHGQLAYLAAAKERFDEASEHYAAAIQIRPGDFFSNFNWANLLVHQKNYVAAIEHYRAAIAAAPENARAHNNYGVALINLQRSAEAAEEFEKAAHADPAFADAEKNLGLVMMMQKNYAGAYEHFQRTLVLDPENKIAKREIARLQSRGRQ